MASTPQINVTIREPRKLPTESVTPTTLKPPEFIAAARSKRDRNYTPRYDIINSE